MELVFVLARQQNHFFVELVAAIRHELDRLGVPSTVSRDGFPSPQQGVVYVLAPPHEYFVLQGGAARVDDGLLARTLFICAEQPGTAHFDQNVRLASRAGAVFDINPWSTHLYRRRGIAARHLQLGYSDFWDRGYSTAARDVDVTFLGAASPRRERYLASYAPLLARMRTRIILSDNSSPNYAAAANFLLDDDKLRLLSRTKVLLNLHQGTDPYFEWLRVLEAIHCGCVVVSEHSVAHLPLVAGRHFVSGRIASLGHLAAEVVASDVLRERMSEEAYSFIRSRLRLDHSVEQLVEAARRVDRTAPVRGRFVPRAGGEIPFPRATDLPLPSRSPTTKSEALRVTLKELRLDLMDLRRELARAKLARRGGPPPRSRVVWRSPRYRAITSPRVSVITALYNHAAWVGDALSSVERGVFQDYELIVVDDGSTDASLEAVRNWSSAHPQTALLLLQHPVNRGLPESRNCGLDFARGEYALILDADNDLLVNCLDRLVPALDAAPDAAFAYGMLACFDETEYLRLVSRFPWEPARLRVMNYIDALALLRISTIREMGGYTTDRRLYGWEDFDLFCRIAERGLVGAFVPEIVARYRVGPASMISITNLSHITAFAALREHCPNLMAGQEMWFPVPPQIPTAPAPFDPQALPEPML